MQFRAHRRLILSALIAVISLQASGAVLALDGRSKASAPAVATSVDRTDPASSAAAAPRSESRSAGSWLRTSGDPVPAAVDIAPRRAPAPRVATPTAQTATPVAATPAPKVTKPATAPAATTSTAYRGTNHVWIPALGVSRDVVWFPCSRTKPPGHQIYSWGCAGRNNVYLFGHAASVMKPLHDAYVSRRLKVGMKVVYADGNGRVKTYKVSYWKVVSPVNSAWAFAAQSRPSMTLQTCVGANSEWRLVVRLVAAG